MKTIAQFVEAHNQIPQIEEDSETVTITINPVDDGAPVASADSASTNEDTQPDDDDQAEAIETQLEVFIGPKPIDLKTPKYPRKEQRLGKEGWVQLNFMISPEGKPYEVVVTDSVGSEAFEKTALRTLKRWTYEPALMDGVPIDAGSNFKIVFALTRRDYLSSSARNHHFDLPILRLRRSFDNAVGVPDILSR